MSRVNGLRALLLVSAAGLLAFAAPAAKLNVLFLIADDLNCDLASYGQTRVATPNLDRLAAGGVRFERAYCQFPLCSPSRSSFLTGRRPDATGVLANARAHHPYSPNFREKLPEGVTLPQLFKNAGWRSVRIGKLYHYGVPLDVGTASLDDYLSWDVTINPRGCDRDDLDRVFRPLPGKYRGTGLSWLEHDREDAAHTDGIAADEAIRQLERFGAESRPFFLAVGFYRPHTPFVAPRKYFDRYPVESIPPPVLSAQDRARTPAPAYECTDAEQDAMSDTVRRQVTRAYWASISLVDAQVGRVLAALDRLGLAERTVVVFTSDHGYHLGDHGLWQKPSLFERNARVPLIIAAPGVRSRGRAAPGVVELVDLYPTLADLCGLTAAGPLDGVSLRPMLDDPERRVKEAAFTQLRRATFDGRSVRTERWRYTEWDEGRRGVELYDYRSDPEETRSLAADPAQAAEVARLRSLLHGR
jgi:uncharacterized sulfatase